MQPSCGERAHTSGLGGICWPQSSWGRRWTWVSGLSALRHAWGRMGPNCHLSGCLPRTPFLQCLPPSASAKLSQPTPAQSRSLDPRFYFHRGICRCPDSAAQRSWPWFPWMVHPFLSTWLLPQPAGSPLWQDDILDQTALHPRVSVCVSPDV